MDFQTKKFWVAQGIVLIITVCMFFKIIPFDTWLQQVLIVEGSWGVLDTVSKIAKKGEAS